MILTHAQVNIPKVVWVLLAVYCGASLIHFTHNAEFVDAYPNLPAWLTRSSVYLAWLAVTAIGATGVLLMKLRIRVPGLLMLAGYAALGLAGLDHYWVAPMSSHTLAMNLTIWFEASTGALLFALVVAQLFRKTELPARRGA